MTRDQWVLARDLFEQAADVAPGDVAAWLRAQTGDAVVIDEVQSLLAADARAGAFLSEPVLSRVGALLDEVEDRFHEGDRLGPYVIVRPVGRGGMGHVYLATDSRLGRQVALKVLAPRHAADAVQRERLRREARAAAALHHPGICTVYALEEIGDEVVIATEYIDGQTLRVEIDSGSRPSPDLLMRTARELAAALASAHQAGVTHRDLKPENVMRTHEGQLTILDFGLALLDDEASTVPSPRMTTPGVLVGTPMYMAPEQIDGQPVDARTDLWALGLVLYEYASGVHPFAAATPLALAGRILESAPAPLGTLRPDVPVQFQHLVHRCLRREPSERPQAAIELLLMLDQPEPPVTSEQVRWWRIHQGAVIALYAVAVVVAWLVLMGSDARAADAAFVFVMVVATIGGVLRGHLLFTHRMHGRQTFLRQLEQVSTPLLATDGVIGVGLLVEGLWVALSSAVPGALIAGLGLAIVLTRVVLERSTTDAAFGPGATATIA